MEYSFWELKKWSFLVNFILFLVLIFTLGESPFILEDNFTFNFVFQDFGSLIEKNYLIVQ